MSHSSELRANAEVMLRQAEAAELPSVRAKLMGAAQASLEMAQRLERARQRRVQEQAALAS